MSEELAKLLINVGERFLVPAAIVALGTAAIVYMVFIIVRESESKDLKDLREDLAYWKARCKRAEKERDQAHKNRCDDAYEMVALDDENRTLTLRIAQADSRAEQIAKAKDKERTVA